MQNFNTNVNSQMDGHSHRLTDKKILDKCYIPLSIYAGGYNNYEQVNGTGGYSLHATCLEKSVLCIHYIAESRIYVAAVRKNLLESCLLGDNVDNLTEPAYPVSSPGAFCSDEICSEDNCSEDNRLIYLPS